MPRPRKWLSWKELLQFRRIYQILRDYPLRCKCGNEDLNRFLFWYDQHYGRIRIRCTVCGRQQMLGEKHGWFLSEIDLVRPDHEEA